MKHRNIETKSLVALWKTKNDFDEGDHKKKKKKKPTKNMRSVQRITS